MGAWDGHSLVKPLAFSNLTNPTPLEDSCSNIALGDFLYMFLYFSYLLFSYIFIVFFSKINHYKANMLIMNLDDFHYKSIFNKNSASILYLCSGMRFIFLSFFFEILNIIILKF